MITAMTFFILLLAAIAVLAAASVRTTLHDSRGTRRPPRSHDVDRSFLPPALG